MAIKFYNIRSKEIRIAEIEPHISAMWASSDRSPNAQQGQDFGWRLAPEVVVELKRIKQDENKLIEIAARYRMSLEDVGEKEILQYISDKIDAANAPVASDGDYEDEYNQEIRRRDLETREAEAKAKAAAPKEVQTTTDTTTESLAQLERRAELEERIAKAKRVAEAETPSPTTTTTTTKMVETPKKA